jgi:hypothetical protein
MNEIIDQMVELYFLGGNIYEMLVEYKLNSEHNFVKNLYQDMFKGWR